MGVNGTVDFNHLQLLHFFRTGTAIAIAAGRRQCRNHLFNLNQHSYETLAKLRQAVELEVSSNTDGGLPERQAMLAVPIIEKVEGILQDVLRGPTLCQALQVFMSRLAMRCDVITPGSTLGNLMKQLLLWVVYQLVKPGGELVA
uniref:Uncharacterized protein n=1 Tax=Trichogramma kaykai TaxID=54128 RepID=A0ABD2WAN9_9HYME